MCLEGVRERLIRRTYDRGLRRVRLIGQAYARTSVVPQPYAPICCGSPAA
jgi:hypothetical protein